MSKDNLLFLGTFFILISFLLFMNVIYSYYFNLYLNVGSYIAPLFISLFIGTGLFLIKIEKKKVSIFNKILIVVFGYFFFSTNNIATLLS